MKHKRKSDCSKFYGLCGVYYLFDDNELIYIGCSYNIGKRIEGHKRGKNKPYKPFTYFAFTETNKKDNYLIESIEINKHLPKFNIFIPTLKV